MVLKKANGGDEETIATADINLSSLISKELKDNRCEFNKNGIQALSMQASVSPVSDSDMAFVDVYLANQDAQAERPAL